MVRGKALLEMMETSIKKYQNNLLSTAEIINELIQLAKDIKDVDESFTLSNLIAELEWVERFMKKT